MSCSSQLIQTEQEQLGREIEGGIDTWLLSPCQDRGLYFKDWYCVFEKGEAANCLR